MKDLEDKNLYMQELGPGNRHRGVQPSLQEFAGWPAGKYSRMFSMVTEPSRLFAVFILLREQFWQIYQLLSYVVKHILQILIPSMVLKTCVSLHGKTYYTAKPSVTLFCFAQYDNYLIRI